jgi:signal transduction histidine kinase
MNCQTVKVLLVEDQPEDAKLMRVALARSKGAFDVSHVSRLAQALERLGAARFDVVLTDLSLPDSSGWETVTRLHAAAANVPIVVLTELDRDDAAAQMLDEGAQDYLAKEFVTGESVRRAIRYARQRQRNAGMRLRLASVKARKEMLAKKNRRLARLNKTAHRFVDNVSHEFRTPLTVIMEYAALLREGVVGQVNEQQREMLNILGDRADDMNTMVDDMLDISKLETGMLCTWRKNCRVADILERVRPSLERKAIVKNVSLEIRPCGELPAVYCDPEKIGRVIINLCVNAIKFCGRPGHVRLWAETDDASQDVVVGVSDDGPGINPSDLAVIFKRFKQLNSNPRGGTKGFGLGLNIAKELVDLNFGQMRVESELGKGSSFSFTIPHAGPINVIRRYLGRIHDLRERSASVSFVHARIDRAADPVVADDVDALLNWVLRRRDLIFRQDSHTWLLVLPATEQDLELFFARVAENREETNRNRPSGTLPIVELETNSVWRLNGQHKEVLTHVERMITPQEIACASR